MVLCFPYLNYKNKTMKTKNNSLVVQDNSLINSCYSLSLIEKRIILLAICQSSKDGVEINADNTITIHASEYMKVFDMQKQASYMALKEASNTLFDRYIPTQGLTALGNIKKLKIRWINLIGYSDNEGIIEIRFNPEIIPLLGYLKDRASFTKYFLEDVAKMTSVHAIRLYELIIAWRTTHKTPLIKLEDLRLKLGIDEGKYKAIKDFKKYVLEVAINQINEHSNIRVEVEQHKKGRSISGFTFTFVELSNPERDPNTRDWINEPQPKKAKRLPEYIFNDDAIQNIFKNISRALKADGHNTEEAKKLFAKVEIDEAYNAIIDKYKLVDANKNPINEITFREKLSELFSIKSN